MKETEMYALNCFDVFYLLLNSKFLIYVTLTSMALKQRKKETAVTADYAIDALINSHRQQ